MLEVPICAPRLWGLCSNCRFLRVFIGAEYYCAVSKSFGIQVYEVMASHSLAIAKASLAASLMRPEPASVPKADVAHFHRLLDALLSRCTATNVQV